MASGHVNRIKGRTHGCTDQCCTREENPCQLGAVHTWPKEEIRPGAATDKQEGIKLIRAAVERGVT